MTDLDQPHLNCPICGQSLLGLRPLPPALLLRCPECGHVTSIPQITRRDIAQRRSLKHLLLWVSLLLLVLAAVLFHHAVQGIGG